MDNLESKALIKRKNWVFGTARVLGILGYKLFAKPRVEINEDVERLKKEKSVFLYAGLHKSLWETSGLLVALLLNIKKIQIPYVGMGDNLVRGRFFQSLAKRLGVFLIKRAKSLKEILKSARQLKEYILYFISRGVDVMVYPEGTRKSIPAQGTYGKFFPTVFEPLLEYEKNKEKIQEDYKNQPLYNLYIIPTNVDYSKVREDKELLEEYKKPRTLHVKDSLKMIKKIREVYITVGKPIKVSDHLDKDRKQLAAYTREKCMDLVKILPINVVARAILDSVDGDRILSDKIEENIAANIQKLSGFSERFRDISIDEDPGEILEKVAKYETAFQPKYLNLKNLPLYRMYANYIGHYFDTPAGGPSMLRKPFV
jgi:1-acyl-sn-glycerol-3-phosphate acyltransferase